MRPWSRRLLIAASLVAVAVLLPATWYHTWVQPGAALGRMAFETGDAVKAGDAALDDDGRGPDASSHGADASDQATGTSSPGNHATGAASAHDDAAGSELDESLGIRIPVAQPGVPAASVDVYAPTDASGLPTVLWIHGGGYIANRARDLADYMRLIAAEGYVVVGLDYSLAPTHHYPTPVVQADAALQWMTHTVRDYGGDPDRIVLGGDSAGAQIASQVAVTQTDAGFAEKVGVAGGAGDSIRGVILFCGLYDMGTVADTGFPMLRTFLWSYTGVRDWPSFARIGELSTTATATDDFPPTLLAVGDADPFEPQSKELAAALTEHGVDVTTEWWQNRDLGHEYQFDFELPEAHHTLKTTLAFVREHTAPVGDEAAS